MAKVECELITQDAIDVEIVSKVVLQDKSVDVEYNGTTVVKADYGFDGLKSVEINTNVPKRLECGDATFAQPASGATSISIIKLLKTLNASCWDTSSVTSMHSMFYGCSSLQQLDVSGWDTSSVTSMHNMFYGCSSLQQLDVSKWDTSSVTSIQEIFRNCINLISLDVGGWDTHKLTTLQGVFFFCQKLRMLDLSSWDASNVTSADYVFHGCYRLETIIGNKMLQDVENGTVALRGIKIDISVNNSHIMRFSSILALANGLSDLTGATAKTMTISIRSYNNMYNDDGTIPAADVIAERQARIAAICAAKNWNFAYA